jgi:hypothetical protein
MIASASDPNILVPYHVRAAAFPLGRRHVAALEQSVPQRTTSGTAQMNVSARVRSHAAFSISAPRGNMRAGR